MTPRSKETARVGLELIACILMFAWARLGSDLFAGRITELEVTIAVTLGVAYWLAMQTSPQARGAEILQPTALACGLTLLVLSFLSFAELLVDVSALRLVVTLVGTAVLLSAIRFWAIGTSGQPRILLVGRGGRSILGGTGLSQNIVDVLDKGEFLESNQLRDAIEKHRPNHIIFESAAQLAALDAEWLFTYKLETGALFETAARFEERLFDRIPARDFTLSNLLLAETQRANRRAMALQAVYANLLGLAMLILCAPILLILGVSCRLGAGPGPIFDRVRCAGFQGVPFLHWRFRVRNVRTGRRTSLGVLVEHLGLTNLPQLFNLVRGEMGLFGPAPVRFEFSEYLDRVAPVHSYRMSIKPGIFGWAQAHTGHAYRMQMDFGTPVPEELLRMAYDLYYLENGSVFVDLKCLLRSLGNIRGVVRKPSSKAAS